MIKFESKNEIDYSLLYESALTCRRSYDHHTIHTIRRGTVEALVDEKQEYTIIAIRGTENLTEWARNCWAQKVSLPEAPDLKVHRGFYESSEQIIFEIAKVIRGLKQRSEEGRYNSLSGKKMPVYLAGHSAGAAIASILGLRLGEDISGIHSFGSPRWCDGATANRADELLTDDTFLRVVNKCDPVPGVPFMIAGYRHCGKRLYINLSNQICDKWPLLARIWDRLKYVLLNFKSTGFWQDLYNFHNIEEYVVALSNRVWQSQQESRGAEL